MPADGGYVRLSARSRPAADFSFHSDLGITELVRCLVLSILSSFTTVQTRHDESVNPSCEGMEGVYRKVLAERDGYSRRWSVGEAIAIIRQSQHLFDWEGSKFKGC